MSNNIQESTENIGHQLLDDIGVTEDMVFLALEKGLSASYSASTTHPSNTAGTRLWQDVVKSMRDSLMLKGWRIPLSDRHIEIISPDSRYKLVIWTGDPYTGLTDGTRPPKSKNGKGGLTCALIAANAQQQLPLFLPMDHAEKPIPPETQEQKLIALMMHHDKQNNEIRSELTEPCGTEYEWSSLDPHSKPRVDTYNWRIIFTPYSTDSHFNIDLDDYEEDMGFDFTDDIDIDITRL